MAARTFISVRAGAHLVPRWIGRRPYDAADVEPLNRMPWPLPNLLYGRRVARELGPLPAGWPLPARRRLEGIPVVSTDLLPAVRRAEVTVKPAVERRAGDRVGFADGTGEAVDRIVYATGYRISLPFLSPLLVAPRGRELPLYRRIVPRDPHAYRRLLRSDLRRAPRPPAPATSGPRPAPGRPPRGYAPCSAGSRPLLTARCSAWWSASVWSA